MALHTFWVGQKAELGGEGEHTAWPKSGLQHPGHPASWNTQFPPHPTLHSTFPPPLHQPNYAEPGWRRSDAPGACADLQHQNRGLCQKRWELQEPPWHKYIFVPLNPTPSLGPPAHQSPYPCPVSPTLAQKTPSHPPRTSPVPTQFGANDIAPMQPYCGALCSPQDGTLNLSRLLEDSPLLALA